MNLNLALRRRAHSQQPRLIPFGVAMQVLLADARRHQHRTGQAGREPNTSGYQTTVPCDEAVVSEAGTRRCNRGLGPNKHQLRSSKRPGSVCLNAQVGRAGYLRL